ncbi:MAG TPA: JAB domain-containing protein, partial [Chitinophagaceae bacterium]
NKVNHTEIISTGGISGTFADPKIIFKKALEYQAVNILICHNHPSGNLRPSNADIDLTKRIITIAQLLEIKVMDHLIVSEEGFYSFADEGLI